MAGTFITFEGPEGAGKTTQISRLADRLEQLGHSVLLTREPGGTREGEQVRSLLLDNEANWSPVAEALLMNAARDAHVRTVIVPALEKGQVVLCDRFADSTRAYQGGGSDLDRKFIATLEKQVCQVMPDLTFIFALNPEMGLQRAATRGRADRFEAKGVEYHRRVAGAFLRLIDEEPRCARVDAEHSIEEVEVQILEIIREKQPTLLDPHS